MERLPALQEFFARFSSNLFYANASEFEGNMKNLIYSVAFIKNVKMEHVTLTYYCDNKTFVLTSSTLKETFFTIYMIVLTGNTIVCG